MTLDSDFMCKGEHRKMVLALENNFLAKFVVLFLRLYISNNKHEMIKHIFSIK